MRWKPKSHQDQRSSTRKNAQTCKEKYRLNVQSVAWNSLESEWRPAFCSWWLLARFVQSLWKLFFPAHLGFNRPCERDHSCKSYLPDLSCHSRSWQIDQDLERARGMSDLQHKSKSRCTIQGGARIDLYEVQLWGEALGLPRQRMQSRRSEPLRFCFCLARHGGWRRNWPWCDRLSYA